MSSTQKVHTTEPEKSQSQDWQLIGNSEAVEQMMKSVEQVAPTDISVLITGESGSGKELIVKAIHTKSLRKNKPLITVNCGAIPEGILESELFGHEKGSFTGATGMRKGYFELADKGTIFLDEIGEMPQSTQVKILRVLENGEFMRVGSGETISVDVRVIAATNRNLEMEVSKNQFRRDLFYRLNAVNINVPPLRDRKEDIPLLVEYFSKNFCEVNKIEFNGFDDSALRMLQKYHWPGNIRELKNIVESIIVLEKGHRIDEVTLAQHLKPAEEFDRHLPVQVGKSVEQVEREFLYRAMLDLKNEVAELRRLFLTHLIPPQKLMPWDEIPHYDQEVNIDHLEGEEGFNGQSVSEMQKNLIRKTLQSTGGNRRKTAQILGISERTLYRKIKQYGL